jgi:hypothetical protein
VRIDRNLFQFQGEFLQIFRLLDFYFKKLAVKKLNATEQENPIFWPIDLFKKINYFNEFPQQVFMISGLKKNSKIYKNFSEKYSSKKKFKRVKLDENFELSNYGLQPAVCDNCYYALKNSKDIKNTIYTTSNKVFRNESSKKQTLDRLMAFTVRDIMFVGSKSFIDKTKDILLRELINFFNKSELTFSIEVADDPFFAGKLDKKLFQHSYELKYEILAYIPFLEKHIAVGSINNHLDTFGKALNIKKKKNYIYSGCIGIGFERLLLALYSQHGNDIKKWPKKFLKLIGFNNVK